MSVKAAAERAPIKHEADEGIYLTPAQAADARRLLAEIRTLFEETRNHVSKQA